jgi:LysR family transcriptional regulator, carnitine catabolism transcriptional activator
VQVRRFRVDPRAHGAVHGGGADRDLPRIDRRSRRITPNLASLRAFVAVARAGSFSEAARLLNVSQPALSRTIRLLEEQVDARLFDRDTRNLTQTAAGAALLPVAERLVGDFDHAFAELAQLFAGERGRLVVGALPSLAARLLPRLIRDFQVRHPLVEIVVRDTLSGALERQFQERQIDLALTAYVQPSGELHFTPIATEPFGLVCRMTDDLADARPTTWDVFKRHPFLAMAPLSSVRIATDLAFSQAGIEAPPLFECAHLATLGGLIEAGLGISALPRSVLALLGPASFVWRPLENPVVERTIGLARPARRTLSPAAEAFAAHVIRESAALF